MVLKLNKRERSSRKIDRGSDADRKNSLRREYMREYPGGTVGALKQIHTEAEQRQLREEHEAVLGRKR